MVTQIDYDNAVEKIRNNELDFSENEIESLIDYGKRIDEFEGDDHRWDREFTTIIELDAKYCEHCMAKMDGGADDE